MTERTTANSVERNGSFHGDERYAFLKREAAELFAAGKDTAYAEEWLLGQNVNLCVPILPDEEIADIIASTIHHKTTFTAAELLKMQLPPIKWAIPEILPEGITILAGRSKIGKSFLAFDWCVAVAAGGCALGRIPVGRGAVLYIALEDNKRRLQKRLGNLIGGRGAPENLTISIEWPKLDAGGVEELREHLDAHPDTRLIVIDILKSIRPTGKAGRNLYDLDYEALAPLKPLINEYGVSIVVVHHTNQGSYSDPLQLISGSEGLVGVVDGTLVMKRERGKMDASLHVAGKDIAEEKEYALRWDEKITNWVLAGDAEEFKMSDQRREILTAMRELARPVTYSEVSNHIDKNYHATRALMLKMETEGLIRLHHTEGATKYFSLDLNDQNSLRDSNGLNGLNTPRGEGDLTPATENGSNTPTPESRSSSGKAENVEGDLTDLTVLTFQEIAEELRRAGSGPRLNLPLYLAGETSLEILTRSVLVARGMDTATWTSHAGAVAAAAADPQNHPLDCECEECA